MPNAPPPLRHYPEIPLELSDRDARLRLNRELRLFADQIKTDNMVWILYVHGEVVSGAFATPPILINENVSFLLMYAEVLIAPGTGNLIIQARYNPFRVSTVGPVGIPLGPEMAIRQGEYLSQDILPSAVPTPRNPRYRDSIYLDIVNAGGAQHLSVGIFCKRGQESFGNTDGT